MNHTNCQFRDKHTVGGIVFYKHAFLVYFSVDDQIVNLSLMYSNRAACQLKTGDLAGAVRDCTRSLQLIPHSVKPLLRRAMAYEHLERYLLLYKFENVIESMSTYYAPNFEKVGRAYCFRLVCVSVCLCVCVSVRLCVC